MIARNKRNTCFLVLIFTILIVAVGYIFGAVWGSPWMGLICAGIFAVVMVCFAFFGGSSTLLAASRAKRIEKKDAPQLFNVVEEISIAAGVPMPGVYIIEDSAPNAFATGRSVKDAKVAITRGLMDKLDRDELQGVMAHELSHIQNRDIIFSMMIGILVGMVVLMCDVFLRSMWFGAGRRRSRREGNAGAILMVVGLLLAILAPLFARMLQLAVSRQREYLADASAAKLTRYPEALARALGKISNDKEVLEVANRATQHLYIVNPIKAFEKRAQSMFSTHPPINDRIRRLKEMK